MKQTLYKEINEKGLGSLCVLKADTPSSTVPAVRVFYVSQARLNKFNDDKLFKICINND